MDLMLAIVQSDDADQVTQALIDSNFRLTRINSAGGFLRRGNATLLIGVDSEREDEALDLIEANCQPRKEANPVKAGMPSHSATVFVLETKRLVRV